MALADEGRCVVAEHALMKGLIGEARRLLEDISASRRDVAAWRLISQIAREDEDDDSVTAALQQAGDAPRSRRWQCTSCQLVHDEWASHCGGCTGFATFGSAPVAPHQCWPLKWNSPLDPSSRWLVPP